MALVQLEPREDGVAVITLTNGKVNAISGAVVAELATIVAELAADLPGAVVVTGSERFFAAGADIAEFGGPDEAVGITRGIHECFDALAALPRLVVAVVGGYALGGGCELALACDLRIAAANAVFGQPEILLGIIPGGGGTQRLARLVGPARAKELCLTGRQVRADEALRIGLADRVEPDHAAALAAALELGAGLAAGATVAQALAKRAIDEGLDRSLADGLLLERELFVEVFHSDDSQIGVQSFLANGPGKAVFTGR
jgi:enoyl-CoA hydratase/carnithine racemase